MKKNNRFAVVGAAIGMLALILDTRTAFEGAKNGIVLCLSTLIPSLFPFFLLSVFLTSSLSGQAIPALRSIANACKIPVGAESLFPISLLGGYPVGAQNISILYRQGHLSRMQSMRMLAFCNNAGPAFIFGILGSMFSSRLMPWILWLIHILSALLVGLLLPGSVQKNEVRIPIHRIRITDTLLQSIRSMALVCSWVILIRIILSFAERWFLWIFPYPVQVLFAGVLELSNGCIKLAELESEGLRFIFAAGFLAFGGICVTLQTLCVADGIPMKLYFPGKILQSSISILLACLFQFIFPDDLRFRCDWIAVISIMVLFLTLSFLHYSKKIVAFR